MRYRLAALLLFTGFTCCGTTNPELLTSFEDINSASQRAGMFGAVQNRLLSIAGLVPHPDAGVFLRHKRSRCITSAIGITAGKSYVLETIAADHVTQADVLAIRDQILDAQQKALEVVTTRMSLTGARAAAMAATAANQAQLMNAVSTAQSAHDAAQQAFQTAYHSTVKKINKSGAIVMRWSTRSETAGHLGLGSLFDLTAAASEQSMGFAVFGGIRTAVLFLGEDYKGSLDQLRSLDNDLRVTTFVFQARHIAYSQDSVSSARIGAALKASYQELANIGETLKAIDKIELGLVWERVASLSNAGYVGEPTRNIIAVPSFSGAVISFGADVAPKYHTVYAVETEADDLAALYPGS